MELKDKLAVVTGGAKGIGAATARLMVEEGARVIVADLDERAGQALLAELNGQEQKAWLVQADISTSAGAARLGQMVEQTFGGLDILVNNAGIQIYGTVETLSEEDWDRTLTINLKSVFLVSKYLIPLIRRRAGGAIVNVASVQALATQPAVSAYAASKGGMLAMTRSMALDYAAENIRVNCVCPGSVDTPMLRANAGQEGSDVEATLQEWGKRQPIKRIGQAGEIAQMIVFLAGPRASFCTGAAYQVDGGLLASFA